MAGSAPTVIDVLQRDRFEIALDGDVVGFVDYHRRPGQIAFTHTEIEPEHEHRGLAGQLIAAALSAARAEGLAVLPFCPYVRAYIQSHPDELDLVPPERRAQFGL